MDDEPNQRTDYFQNQLTDYFIYYTFLELNYLSKSVSNCHHYLSIVGLLIVTSYVIRALIFTQFTIKPIIAIYLGDYATILDNIHDTVWFINCLWCLCTIYCWKLIKQSNCSIKKQQWFKLLIMTNLSPIKSVRLAFKLSFTCMKLSTIGGILSALSLHSPQLVNSDPLISLATTINGLIAAFGSFNVVTNCVNFGIIFSFYAFTIGQKFQLISKLFRSYLIDQFNCEKTITIKVNQLIVLLQDVNQTLNFWSQLNSCIFICTFFAQILILYLVFFVSINLITRTVLIALGLINLICGQSVTFFTGAYARIKVKL